MIKVILNNDTEHVLSVNDINHSVIMGIDDYSEHSENINLNVKLESLGEVSNFENVEIKSLQILDEEDKAIATLTLGDDLYITNYNSTIFNSNATTYVNINKIKKTQANPVEE